MEGSADTTVDGEPRVPLAELDVENAPAAEHESSKEEGLSATPDPSADSTAEAREEMEALFEAHRDTPCRVEKVVVLVRRLADHTAIINDLSIYQ